MGAGDSYNRYTHAHDARHVDWKIVDNLSRVSLLLFSYLILMLCLGNDLSAFHL